MQVADVELHVETEGAGPPLLVLHGGLGLDHTYLKPYLSPLASRAELIFYDQRGNGRSPSDVAAATLDTWADDADALCATLGHDRVVVFGHSAGGIIALVLALRHPERVAGLILCGASAVLDHWDLVHAELHRRGADAAQWRAFTGGPWVDDADMAAWLEAALPLYYHRPVPEVMSRMPRPIVRSAASQRFGECLAGYDVRGRLGEITVPVLVLAGRHDFIMPLQVTAEVLAGGLPDADLVVFSDSGHFPFAEEAERFLATVGAWLDPLAMPDGTWRLRSVPTGKEPR